MKFVFFTKYMYLCVMKTHLRIICLGIFFLVFGEIQILMANDECGNITFLFTPVREEFVDELPEGVRNLPTKSMLPIVYRGAAKNWGAMKWTPKSLNEMKFSGSGGRNVYRLNVYIQEGKRTFTNKELSDLLEKDTMFRENYLYGAEFNTPKIEHLMYLLFHGPEGAEQFGWDIHQATLLAQFFGERLVLLIPPDEGIPTSTALNLVECVDKTLKEYMQNGLTIREAIMKMVDNEELDEFVKNGAYSPLQRVILEPGDVLYIPTDWGHRVFYLKDSAGVAQQIMRAHNPV